MAHGTRAVQAGMEGAAPVLNAVDAIDPELVFPPSPPVDAIAFILAEHGRHRRMSKVLDALAESRDFRPKVMAQLVDFIRFDLTLHVIDEEDDFFPLLSLRCDADDDIGAALDGMKAEHAGDHALSERVRDALNRCLIERKAPADVPGAAQTLTEFSQRQLRHMALESAVLIPLARRRFSRKDIESLGRKFIERRSHFRQAPLTNAMAD